MAYKTRKDRRFGGCFISNPKIKGSKKRARFSSDLYCASDRIYVNKYFRKGESAAEFWKWDAPYNLSSKSYLKKQSHRAIRRFSKNNIQLVLTNRDLKKCFEYFWSLY